MPFSSLEGYGAERSVDPSRFLPEDHAQFFGVCSGLAADAVIVDFLAKADLLIGVGFDPVESDKVWHQTMKLVSIAPVSIAAGQFRPALELIGDTCASLTALAERTYAPPAWTREDENTFRTALEQRLHGLPHPTHLTHLTHQTHPTHPTHLTHAAYCAVVFV